MRQLSRRAWLMLSAAGLATFGRAAAAAARTPAQTEGPYYPVARPADAGADLLGQGARGTPLALSGRVRTTDGAPVDGVTLEIWQADANGVYRHPRAPAQDRVDPHFAGFGRTTSNAGGVYAFRTIVPAPYPGRPPHIHVKLFRDGREVLTTQLYIEGHADNERSGLFSSLWFRNSDRLLMTLADDPAKAGAQRTVFDFTI